MNTIFIFVMIMSIGLMCFSSPESILDTLIIGSNKALRLAVNLTAIYAIWLSVINIMQSLKLDKALSRLMRPLTKRMFPNSGDAEQDIVINITTNIFGMGNASTPSGIEAMKKLNSGSKKITPNMAMLFILNVTSLEIIPTTTIGLRLAHFSQNAYDIIVPTFIATLSSTIMGVTLTKLLCRGKNNG